MSERVSTDHCLKAGIAGAKEFARVSGFTLNLSPDRLIDDQHLHCVFYGGDIGSIKLPNGWAIVISANGDIDLTAELEDGTKMRTSITTAPKTLIFWRKSKTTSI